MSRRFHKNIGLLILSAAVMMLASSSSKSNGVDGFLMLVKTQVKVFNHLQTHKDLMIHCRSQDDDLLVHRLRYGEHFEWSFRVNFFARTQYYCSFEWPGATRWFDIYIGWRDDKLCDTCLWGIKEDRVCMLNTTDYIGNCFEYNK
ncbi:hypothetical protein QN277_022034 [Acacia crassicarpa]|uniref:S-protein homolog n=1 Tax=Acacia crassicarpa TaxID=499986 RepID=A0AAE1MQ48_9FABA|nr:hypothetical protein QN277_022034 [Acacia crassicarpa]